ncbi:MAG: 50S ribosomal protein L25 [Thermoleophilia bacterium]
MAHVALHAHARTEFGNGPARRLRRQGLVPGIVYQAGESSLTLALPDRDLRRALAEGRTSVIDLSIGDGPSRPVLVRDWQLDPVRGDVLHIDFQEVDLKVEIEAPVSVVLEGNAVGVRDGGVLDQPLREVVVSALPDALPDHLELDVTELEIGSSITVAELSAPAGVTIVTDAETVIASVVAPTGLSAEDEAGGEVDEEAPVEAEAEGGDSPEE